jgi:hypothetical protein
VEGAVAADGAAEDKYAILKTCSMGMLGAFKSAIHNPALLKQLIVNLLTGGLVVLPWTLK